MMQNRFHFAVVACALLLGGCATPEEKIQQRVAAIPETGRGYIAGTFAVDCKLVRDGCMTEFASEWIHYRSADGQWDDHLSIGVLSFLKATPYDYELSERREKGIHFCVPLQPGSYGIYSFSYNGAVPGGTTYTFKKDRQFDLPFSVKPGEVAYLGTLKMTNTHGKNLLGMELPGPGLLLLSSAPKAGTGAALQKCPESVRQWPVRDASLQAIDATTPLVRMDSAP